MTTIQRHPQLDFVAETEVVTHGAARKALAVLRIAFGLTFLWAFFDNLLALGFHTGAIVDEETGARTGIDLKARDAAWLNGGSPTEGSLTFAIPAHIRSRTSSTAWRATPGPTGCSWPACSASGWC
jgi:thiosulfate dehydrogenase [quinone] large subunit